MTDSTVLQILSDAWRGIRQKESKLRHSRFSERYVFDLRKAMTPDRRRGLLAEFLAEGLIEVGGSNGFHGSDACMALWSDGESDGWERLRDLALVASVEGGAK